VIFVGFEEVILVDTDEGFGLQQVVGKFNTRGSQSVREVKEVQSHIREKGFPFGIGSLPQDEIVDIEFLKSEFETIQWNLAVILNLAAILNSSI
jgi:hypothetical protein